LKNNQFSFVFSAKLLGEEEEEEIVVLLRGFIKKGSHFFNFFKIYRHGFSGREYSRFLAFLRGKLGLLSAEFGTIEH